MKKIMPIIGTAAIAIVAVLVFEGLFPKLSDKIKTILPDIY